MLPEIVLLGLIFVNFFPPILLPTIYPPISESIQIDKINKIPSTSNHAFALKVITVKKNKYIKLIVENINNINLFFQIFLLKLIMMRKESKRFYSGITLFYILKCNITQNETRSTVDTLFVY